MTSINTLIPDIYKLVGGEDVSSLVTPDLGTNIASAVQQSLGKHERRGLRLSGLGPKCPKHLWHSVNTPELEEPIPPYARIKFTYGHIIEHLVTGLAAAAGHRVEGQQDELVVDGIVGHRDCVIDGAIVDVKSASSLSFKKFKDKTIAENDDFGYLDQLDAYLVGSLHDPLVTVKDRAYLLAVDKTLGHMALYEHRLREKHIRLRIQQYKEIVSRDRPPSCQCATEPDGESGNIILGTTASYSGYKHLCFPGLRTFIGSGGKVRHFSKVVKIPKYKGFPLKEVDKHGNVVYNG